MENFFKRDSRFQRNKSMGYLITYLRQHGSCYFFTLHKIWSILQSCVKRYPVSRFVTWRIRLTEYQSRLALYYKWLNRNALSIVLTRAKNVVMPKNCNHNENLPTNNILTNPFPSFERKRINVEAHFTRLESERIKLTWWKNWITQGDVTYCARVCQNVKMRFNSTTNGSNLNLTIIRSQFGGRLDD